jgi:alanine or glycine:cation symporter, AGCS family
LENFLDFLLSATHTLSGWIWWPLVIIMLFSCGIYLTIQTNFIQFRKLGLAIKFMFLSRKKESTKNAKGEITPFQALMTALAATVGNGNIAGVATAIVAGGAGAPFWMWMTALFGMATKFSEGMLGLKYRRQNADGSYSGGAMYYLEEGIPFKKLGKFLAIWFSLAVMFMATFGSGNMAQSNSIALALNSDFGINFSVTGIILVVVCGIILIGGIKRIASFSEKLVPLMIVLYMGSGFLILFFNLNLIPEAFSIIFESAFSFEAVGGGIAGHTIKEALRYGVARGTLSSESGIGSCSIPAAAAKGNESVAQGLVAMMGTFIDTIVVCSMTTIIIISSGLADQGADSVALTKAAFSSGLGSDIGGTIVSLSSAIFGFTTLIGWAYIGEQGFRYLFKNMNVNIYRIIFCIFAGIGTIIQGKYLAIVWNFGDIANALMAIPNIIGLFFLGSIIKKGCEDYFKRWDSGELKNPFGS